MAGVLRFPKIFGAGPRIEKEPAPGWDVESEALVAMLQWLSTLETQEQRLRVLAYCMWRVKSGDDPKKIGDWVESVAEHSAEIIGGKVGFGETGKS